MPYAITKRCIQCDHCLPQCPEGAIQVIDGDYWIDPSLCNDCEGYMTPQCVLCCPVNSPVPYQAKKGRCKVDANVITSQKLFTDGKGHPFASAIVIWELCNVLAQRQSLPWQVDADGELYYQRQINGGKGAIAFRVTDSVNSEPESVLKGAKALSAIEAFDIRSACMHLIYAAHATNLDQPWEEKFTINDRQIEDYLGLEKRKDLSKTTKLALIKELAQQPCQLIASIDLPAKGKIPGVYLEKSRLWHLLDIQHHFQEDDLGCKHLVGLTFTIKVGQWAEYFLNRQGCKERTAFYQYGTLPKALLNVVMSIWQQHEGAARMMLWLLFKTKIGREQRITIPTLMRVAYGERKLSQVSGHPEHRQRLLRIFESDLEVLNYHGLKPIFDPVTYPLEIQPLWAKLVDIPEDAEAALDFWIDDGSNGTRLTDAAPRGKWNRLMNARILYFEVPPEWKKQLAKSKKKQRTTSRKTKLKPQIALSVEYILEARKRLGLSQRDLAKLTGKSQSWIRDIENGRFEAKLEDQMLLQKALAMGNG
ncbi:MULTISPECIES: helix-turn-helix domain-containing protein [unclassified Tolypothrix]|uniref:helix-turn-helix domain-containing protein n=1 Tax=unclassified Tolypothrix TaxID=2649714 RepID=UPI0005EAB06A|nr:MULTISPECIES: helix-turn-helix domain-containing protein [unclassified Tolypothrix]BAY88184.1 XRE family transcriptional regulator [Microchaete diplosiphon NIES-3275]EKF02043.1 RE family transcriptional regulator [Tolypothrix sp. PCC 7601]MBE9085638.1 helix-turn-helix domain-containing protein [Tolypothrix sp. LEGE 11397]UYD28886.1 helix-turn-helix domain-containing protein [Tolypothrix sp. PCC 7712]UYD35202.1 helix-turn-helix domain-containing protein [Tolypothrix sp. PCC 7601]